VRLLHDLAKIHVTFDDPNLVSRAGLVPVMALAQRAGLTDLAGEHVRIARRCGANPPGEGALRGCGDDRRGGQHRRSGPAAARGDAVAVWRGPGAVHAGVVPALVHLGQRAAAGEGEPAVAGGAGPACPAAAGQGCGGLRGHRRHAKAGLRAPEAGRGVRAHQDRGEEPAGARAERAGRHDQHAAGRAGDRRDQAAWRQRELGPGRGVVRHRIGPHRPGGRVQRDAGGAGRLGVLLGGVHRRGARGRGVLLGHGSDEPARQGGYRVHQRERVDPHPISPGHLG
jgi:hypothetical protein